MNINNAKFQKKFDSGQFQENYLKSRVTSSGFSSDERLAKIFKPVTNRNTFIDYASVIS